jgi:lipid A ethanolaminephosphotransferase
MITNILDTTPAESFALLSGEMVAVLDFRGFGGIRRLVD